MYTFWINLEELGTWKHR